MLFGLIAVVGACLVFWSITYGRRRTVAVPKPADASAPAAGPDSPRSLLSGALARLAAPAMRGERSNRLQSRLNAAGLSLKAYEFVGIQLVCVFIVAAVGWFRFGNPLVALGGGVAGYFAPALYLRRVERKRKRTLNAQLGDTISLMSNGLKAGYSIQQALASVADTGRKPISDEIRRVVREMSLGIELETSLQHLNERLQSPDFDMMVTAILIHRRVGGNLAEVLAAIHDAVTKVNAISQQAMGGLDLGGLGGLLG